MTIDHVASKPVEPAHDMREFDWDGAKTKLSRSLARLSRDAELSPAESAAILRERARRLAVVSERQVSAMHQKAVAFTVGGERFAVPSENAVVVLASPRVTVVPGTGRLHRGVILHQGRVIALLDLAVLLDLQGRATDDMRLDAVVVASRGMEFAIAAEPGVELFDNADGAQLSQASSLVGAAKAYVRGVTHDGTVFLDLNAIARDPKIVVNAEVV